MTAESGLLQSDTDLPTVHASEALIAKDAPAVLAYLQRKGAEDLAEMLGIGGAG